MFTHHMEVIKVSVKGVSNAANYQAASNTATRQTEQVNATQVQGRTIALEREIQNIEKIFQTKGESQDKSSKDVLNQSQKTPDETLKKAVEILNKQLAYTEAQYGYHEATNRVVIKIVDRETDEVLREVPPEKTLEMITKVWELAGMLVDEKL